MTNSSKEVVKVNINKLIGQGYKAFWNSKKMYRVLKGGRGSKKSITTGYWCIYNIMKHPKANVLCVRQTFNTHKDSTFAVLKWCAEKLQVSHLWQFKESPLEAVYKPTGQKILFRGFDDPLKLTSITVSVGVLCWVWIEEAYEIDDEQEFKTLDESIRGVMPDGLFKQITLTYNPWINSHWTKTRFFDNVDPDAFTLTTTYRCNEWLDDADRRKIEALEFTDPERFKVVGLGEYGIPGGAYFNEFRTDIHVLEPFPLPDTWRRYFVMDYGLDMFAGYFAAVDEHNRAYFYKELYQSDLKISDAAKMIQEYTTEPIYEYLAPPDMWNRRQETGKSAAELFYECGITFSKAINSKEQGCYNMKEWLAPYEDIDGLQVANVRFFRNCKNLIRCLPQLQIDDKKPNEYADKPHELTHSVDALRYFLAGRPSPYKAPPKEPHYNFDFEKPKPDILRGERIVI